MDIDFFNVASLELEKVKLEIRGNDLQNESVKVLHAKHEIALIGRRHARHVASYKFLPDDIDVEAKVDTALVRLLVKCFGDRQ